MNESGSFAGGDGAPGNGTPAESQAAGNRAGDTVPGNPSAGFVPPPAPKRSFGRRHWGKLTLFLLLAVPIAGLVLWTVIGLNYTYSSGDRAGYVQKISRKGWVCKTWEGTLYTDIAKGFRSDSFNFSVRNDSIAKQLEKLSGKRVAVTYDQHTLVPTSCFGDTEYFVSGVRELPE